MKYGDINEAIVLKEELNTIYVQSLNIDEGISNTEKEKVVRNADVGCIYHMNKDHNLAIIKQIMKTISQKYKKKIVLFTVNDLNVDKNKITKAYFIDGHTEEITDSKIPTYIYNFVLHSKPSSVSKMRQLRMMKDIEVINPVNRFYQNVLFDMITSIIKTKDIMLPYATTSNAAIRMFTEKYDDLILLPQRTSKGYRVISIKKTNSHGNSQRFEIAFGSRKHSVPIEELYFEIKKMIRNKKHLIMKDPSPVIWNHSPLEIRVYIQKGITGKWTVLGSIAKKEFFSKDSLYDKSSANLAEVLLEYFPDKLSAIQKRIHEASLDSTLLLDYYIPNLGSAYVDFIIDSSGNPYVIWVGGFEQESYLYEVDDGVVWNEYIRNAGLYLVYLSNKE